MLADFGYGILIVTFLLALYAIGAAVFGYYNKSIAQIESARRSMLLIFPLLTVASAALIALLLGNRFDVQFVYEVTSRSMPAYLKITAWWGGQSGSLLFWSWLMSAFASAVTLRKWDRDLEFLPWVIVVACVTLAFFLALNILFENPFARLYQSFDGQIAAYQFAPAGAIAVTPPDGRGLNPLLRHPGMIIHPPMLYLGFVSFVIPYAFAMAALITGRTDDRWIRLTRRWSLWAWLFLSFGLVLGGRWAYDVLGWGGYWGWDPVEISSFMPWLTATAFLHSVMIQEKRGMLKQWNMVLVILTYDLVIFGTFLTRSGVLSSVHAFAQSAIGPAFFIFIGLTFIVSIGLLIHRWDDLRAEAEMKSMLSREALFLLNNLLFLSVLVVCFWGVIFPLISELATGQKVTVGPPFYERANAPLFAALMLLMGVAPLSAWGHSTLQTLGRAIWKPAIAAVVITLFAFITYTHNIIALIGFFLVALVILVTLYEFWRGARARQKVQRELKALQNSQSTAAESDPQMERKIAYEIAFGTVYFVGGLTLVLGLVTVLFNVDFLAQKSNGVYQIIFGLIFLVWGYFVQRKSKTALVLAITIYGLDSLVAFFSLISQGSFLAISFPILRFIFIAPMLRGIGAMKALDETKFYVALVRLTERNRRRYGGYIIHISMMLMAIGILGIELFQQSTQGTLEAGQSLELQGYKLVYKDIASWDVASRNVNYTRAVIEVYKNGQPVAELHPRTDYYFDAQQNMTIPGVRSTFADDVYIILVDWEPASATGATFKVYLNPLVNWLWIGTLLFLLGVIIAAWPDKEPETAPARARRKAIQPSSAD